MPILNFNPQKIMEFFKGGRKFYELLLGMILILLMTSVAFFRLLDPFEMLFLDLRFHLRGTKPFPKDIVIIGVDESSLDAFGRWPWPRDKHAKLVDLLSRESFRPNSLAFDMLFEQKEAGLTPSGSGDADLAYRSKNFQNQIVMSYFFEKSPVNSFYIERYERDLEKEKRLETFALKTSESPPEYIEEYQKVSLPFSELADFADLAFVNTPSDADGRTRRTQLLGKYRGKIYPSLDLQVVLHYLGASMEDVRLENDAIVVEKSRVGPRRIPISSRGEMLINYYGGSEAIPSASFLQVLDSGKAWIQGAKPELLKSLKDKIVLVGVTALGIGDRRTTPYNRYEPGISLHAHTIANIIQENYLVRAPAWVSCAAMVGVGIFVILVTMLGRITRSFPFVLAAILIYFLAAQILFTKGIWIDFAVQTFTFVVVFISITSFRYFTALEELKRTHNQLIQSAKMASLGELSAGIAHEFRNILNAINLNVEVALSPNLTPERKEKYALMLKKIMTNATLILEGLLTFSRQSQAVKTPGNLKETVLDTLLLVEKELIRHTIESKTDLAEVPEISYDRGQISQVIMNLMNNARDALKDRPSKEIKLTLREDGDFLRIDIADNGTGIPPQVLKRLFQPFVTSKPAGKGTGLGLSVCHGIIKGHGGDIKVTTVQGKGTTWHIYLPKK